MKTFLEIINSSPVCSEMIEEHCGVSRCTVWRWKTGRSLPRFFRLWRLAGALRVDYDELSRAHMCSKYPMPTELRLRRTEK